MARNMIRPGHLPEEYMEAEIETLIRGIVNCGGYGTSGAYALLREYAIALRRIVDMRTSDDYIFELRVLCDLYTVAARDVYRRRGQDWNPEFDLFDLETDEARDAFQPCMAADLQMLLNYFDHGQTKMGRPEL